MFSKKLKQKTNKLKPYLKAHKFESLSRYSNALPVLKLGKVQVTLEINKMIMTKTPN